LLRVGSEDCRPRVRHSPQVQQLVQELRALEQMQRQQVRLTNQLRQVLLQYYPTMLHLFSSLNTQIALRFLKACPNPQTAAGLSRLELAALLKQQGYTRMSQLDRLYQKLQVAMPTTEVWQGYGQHVLALVPLLQTLQVQIALLRQQVQHTFATHPEAAWWQALPGAGDLTVCRLLALIGDNRQAFTGCEALQALAGTGRHGAGHPSQRQIPVRSLSLGLHEGIAACRDGFCPQQSGKVGLGEQLLPEPT
jgi:hypothetical protein